MPGLGGSQPIELFGSLSDAIRAAVQAELRSFRTALPVIVKEDSDGHNATAQPVVNALVRQDDGTMQELAWPELQTMIVHFTGGGLMVETHPVKAGDEGLVSFLSRNIDAWRQSGGTQNPVDARQHSPSDHVYIGGVKSDPNKIKNYQPDSIQHRSLDAKVTHDTHPTNGITERVVPQSDPSKNPFESATTFFQTLHSPNDGILKTATDGNNLHTLFLTLAGILGQVKNSTANHTFSCPVTTGPTLIGKIGSQISQVLVNPAGLELSSTAGITLSAPSVNLPAGTTIGGAGGAVGGDLSGTLPNPTVKAIHLASITVATLPSANPGGQLCYVTDATSLTNGTVVAGGGSGHAIVKSNDSQWIVLG